MKSNSHDFVALKVRPNAYCWQGLSAALSCRDSEEILTQIFEIEFTPKFVSSNLNK